MVSYFKRFYLNDVKLAQRALLEFHRALVSGRMIAFTGSLTTEPFGYGNWSQIVDAYVSVTDPLKQGSFFEAELNTYLGTSPEVGKVVTPELDKVLRYARGDEGDRRPDLRVVLSLVEEIALGNSDAAGPPAFLSTDWERDHGATAIDILSTAIARYFRAPVHAERFRKALAKHGHRVSDLPDVPQSLITKLPIRRFATLNYDFELEGRTMLEGASGDVFTRLREMRLRPMGESIDWDLDSGRIRRVKRDGTAVESDILNRERIDRMFEFAVGADDVDQHVMHVHGRACSPASMILSYRDYDRLYRRNDLYKLPFEFAQKVMIGGNPILFVGLGMSEEEVNRTMQDFISNSPYQRVAPTFLLWNFHKSRGDMTARDWREAEMMRLDRFHRLGVLTIFDVDLPVAGKFCPRKEWDKNDVAPEVKTAAKIINLDALIAALPGQASKVAQRENHVDDRNWRNMGAKTLAGAGPLILWQVDDRPPYPDPAALALAVQSVEAALLGAASGTLCVLGSQGCGKGSLAHALVESRAAFASIPLARRMLINGGFSFDTDSVLDGVARFLHRHFQDYLDGDGRPIKSRSAYFTDIAGRANAQTVLIVLNGSERFFGVDGQILSAELEELIALAARQTSCPIKLVLLGTERVRDYLVTQRRLHFVEFGQLDGVRQTLPALRLAQLDAVRTAFGRSPRFTESAIRARLPGLAAELDRAVAAFDAQRAGKISGDGADVRRAFYRLYLDRQVLGARLRDGDFSVAIELLRALAFIGLPVEVAVLAEVPRIKAVAAHADLVRLLNHLVDLRLALCLKGHGDQAAKPAARYTLHRSLLTELRDRFSIPLSEAKLSTAFNMSLYVAQPIDGYIPEPDIHDELGQMVDRLLGVYKEAEPDEIAREAAGNGRVIPKDLAPVLDRVSAAVASHERPLKRNDTFERAQRRLQTYQLCLPKAVQCLRTALALVRGYYTTTDLFTLDIGDRLIREDRDGILLEHAERLDTLLDGYGKLAMARVAFRDECNKAGLDWSAIGTIEPFYPDELVWLHNERAVVRLAMGDLYEAKISFERALDVNRRHVELDDRAHNWRRIRLNQLTLDLEMGDIGLAQRKIAELLTLPRLPGIELREDGLAQALATGYRGWCRHLQGDPVLAVEDYDAAIKHLRTIREMRAHAYFQRLRASARNRAMPDSERQHEFQAALDLATATRQMDLAYRIRIMVAEETIATLDRDDGENHTARNYAYRLLDDAMRYALQTDTYRVRVEAGMALAQARFGAGDYEGALRNATDALMVATRFGMELRKITLRSLLAKIMGARGHPLTAANLAMSSIRIASRRRFQTAIEHAEAALQAIPRISAITDIIDQSVRRIQ